jgi:copper chaperone CopZ
MRQYLSLVVVWVVLMAGSFAVRAEDSRSAEPRVGDRKVGEALVQIGGRFCEYDRQDVDGALRRFAAVQDVEFLNQHGTVLVRYQKESVSPEQLAAAVERALAMGWNCKAWVDRGG